MNNIKVKKIAPLLLSMILCSSSVLADSEINGNNTLSLSHDDIFEVYKEHNIVYDQSNMPHNYGSNFTAITMSLNSIKTRLRAMKSDMCKDYLYSENIDVPSLVKLKHTIKRLESVIVKLEKISKGYLSDNNMIDRYHALSVVSDTVTSNVLKRTKIMTKVGDMRSGYAHELNLIANILKEISVGYKEKSLKLILERGYVDSNAETSHTESLNFKF